MECTRTLILAWNHESLHIDVLLPHQIPQTFQPVCGMNFVLPHGPHRIHGW